MRITIIVTLALLVIGACQLGSAGPSPTPAIHPASTVASSQLIADRPATGFTDADFARHVELLKSKTKKKLASPGSRPGEPDFSFVIQRPFVIVGDESKQAVQEHAETTVKWAVDRLKQDFFPNDPKEILEIWLFKDEASYEKHAALLFNDKPTTPYGYYSSAHKALIMNIATGGGTLVHEIVHPFMEANFPACPPWLNEGLGSLYEQCGDSNGHIRGFTNWRLPGLQRAIRSKLVPSFKELTALDSNAFYNEDKGVNYAQSRYLCYYLQEKGLLVKFFREFQAQQKEDATGFKTLQDILGEADMEAFKTKWEKYVLNLRQGYEVTADP
ncbi:MAG TPA: hypothetical protein VMZ30_11875 [Pyrinomonadaceae bacterium]|nr:hypothetical protein [Pyrinomonadaceae bacterium]